MAEYQKDESGEIWWCKSHKRMAEFIQTRSDGTSRHHCDPSLGGIMLPCDCERIPSDAKWREDAEKVMQSMHERICALEAAVISQQKIMEAMATDALKPKLIRVS